MHNDFGINARHLFICLGKYVSILTEETKQLDFEGLGEEGHYSDSLIQHCFINGDFYKNFDRLSLLKHLFVLVF